ncbi:MAG: tetratricopeptide repeat protein [Myxococcota bacterium]|nr:tetratricopeptide repeat protein [Myxococcota bacterium]
MDWSAWANELGGLDELRLRRAADAFEKGQVDEAITEAEELLDDDPDNVDALLVVGEASLEVGAYATARLAFEHVLQLGPDNLRAWAGLSLASFELTELDSCVKAAQHAIQLEPAFAPAWYYLGVGLEFLGHLEDADRAFRQAARLEPVHFPYTPTFSEATWTRALDLGRDLLPEQLRDWFIKVPLTLAWLPDLEELRTQEPPLSPAAGALYKGTPPPVGFKKAWATAPEQVRVYRRNLERGSPTEAELPLLVARALRQEALDWLGLPDDALPLAADADSSKE